MISGKCAVAPATIRGSYYWLSQFLKPWRILAVSFIMKKFVALVFAIAGLAFLSEPTARAGVSFAFGFPIPIPIFYGAGYYNPYPYYGYPGFVSYGPYWRNGFYYGRGYYGTGPYGRRYYSRGFYGNGPYAHRYYGRRY